MLPRYCDLLWRRDQTGSQFQPAEMFPQGVAHQSGSVSLSALRGLVGRV
jgi:hypothetical protein